MNCFKRTSLLLLSLFAGVVALSWQSHADTRPLDGMSAYETLLIREAKRENPFDYARAQLAEIARIQGGLESEQKSIDETLLVLLDRVRRAEFELIEREGRLDLSTMYAAGPQVNERDCYVSTLYILSHTEELLSLVGKKADSHIESALDMRAVFARQLLALERENEATGCRELYRGSQDQLGRPKSTGPSEHNDGGVERGRGGGGS